MRNWLAVWRLLRKTSRRALFAEEPDDRPFRALRSGRADAASGGRLGASHGTGAQRADAAVGQRDSSDQPGELLRRHRVWETRRDRSAVRLLGYRTLPEP